MLQTEDALQGPVLRTLSPAAHIRDLEITYEILKLAHGLCMLLGRGCLKSRRKWGRIAS